MDNNEFVIFINMNRDPCILQCFPLSFWDFISLSDAEIIQNYIVVDSIEMGTLKEGELETRLDDGGTPYRKVEENLFLFERSGLLNLTRCTAIYDIHWFDMEKMVQDGEIVRNVKHAMHMNSPLPSKLGARISYHCHDGQYSTIWSNEETIIKRILARLLKSHFHSISEPSSEFIQDFIERVNGVGAIVIPSLPMHNFGRFQDETKLPFWRGVEYEVGAQATNEYFPVSYNYKNDRWEIGGVEKKVCSFLVRKL